MVVQLIGRYEHSLDAKGRVILPARFRPRFAEGTAYLSQHHEGCLALWTPENFEKQMAHMEALQERGPAERNLARIWASGSAEVEIDKQGRVPIPAYLREFARLEDAVLVVGAIDRIELWNPSEWQARVQPNESVLAGVAPTSVASGND